MKTKKLKIVGEKDIHFLIKIHLNRVYINIIKSGYESSVELDVPYYIQKDKDDIMKNPTDLKHIHILKEDFDLPTELHNVYQDYLRLSEFEEEIFKPISNQNMKVIEFGEVHEGEEDYLP